MVWYCNVVIGIIFQYNYCCGSGMMNLKKTVLDHCGTGAMCFLYLFLRNHWHQKQSSQDLPPSISINTFRNSSNVSNKCSAVQCSPVQCSPVQCSAVQCSPVQLSAVQRNANISSGSVTCTAMVM